MDGIDWSYWANLDVVDYRDACILSCGYDPKVIAGHALPEGLDAAIQQRETIAKSHLGGALPAYATDADRYHDRSAASGVKLAEFRAWGRSLPMPLTFPCGFPEPPRPVRAEPSNEELARVARMDLWSQRELAELCTGWIPGRHGMNEAEAIAINEASEAIARGTLSGSLAFIPRNDADSAAIMYGTARHYVPAVAAEWAATRFDAFPAKLLAAVRERVEQGLVGSTAGKWPWGDHETEYLRLLGQAASKFWTLYDPADATTAPTNDQIEEWLKQQTVRGEPVSARIAGAMATILRADGLPNGPRK